MLVLFSTNAMPALEKIAKLTEYNTNQARK